MFVEFNRIDIDARLFAGTIDDVEFAVELAPAGPLWHCDLSEDLRKEILDSIALLRRCGHPQASYNYENQSNRSAMVLQTREDI